MQEIEYYELNGISFILSSEKTIIRTPFQTFLAVPARHNYSKKMERLRNEIRRGNMRSMTEIVSYCNLQPGRRGQMLGIMLVNSVMTRHEDNAIQNKVV